MTAYLYRVARPIMAVGLVWAALISPGSPGMHPACAEQSTVNALYLLTLPPDYQALEDLIASARNSGANTIIIRPVSSTGKVDKQAVAKAVFFAHNAGLKLFVILPSRAMTFLLDEHPEWEDMRYDLRSGTIQPAGKLDLFNADAAAYLTNLFADIAGYSVDAIMLDDDFFYPDVEGMSGRALELYRQKYGSRFSARSGFGKVKKNFSDNHRLEEYGETFWNFAELKKNNLMLLLKTLMEQARTVNKDIRFGIPLTVPGPFLSEKEVLAWYSLDVTALKKSDVNFFWLAVRHREMRAREGLNYKKSIEAVSRIVTGFMSVVNDPARMIIALQTVPGPRKVLPVFEIEEVSAQVKKAGEPGIAFMVEPGTKLPPVLTQKMFRRQAE